MESGNDIGKIIFPASDNVGNWKPPLYGVSISNVFLPGKSVLDVDVSSFKDYYTVKDPGTLNLRDFLNGALNDDRIAQPPDWYYTRKNKPIPFEYRPFLETTIAGKTARECAELLRRDIQKKGCTTLFHSVLKSLLPGITVSGVFSRRNEKGLLQHSGLICLDIDWKDNRHIGNFADLKRHLANIEEVAYVGLSVSGQGYFVLIPISNPEQHLEHFLALQRDFAEFYQLKVDNACKDVSRLRGYTFDDAGVFRENAPAYTKMLSLHSQVSELSDSYKKGATPDRRRVLNPVSNPLSKGGNSRSGFQDTRESVEALVNEIVSRRIDITPTEPAWFEIGCALANEFGESGRDLFHAVSQFHIEYNYREADSKFDHCLKDRYRYNIGTFFHHCRVNGITLTNDKPINTKSAVHPMPSSKPEAQKPAHIQKDLNSLAKTPAALELIERFDLQFIGAAHLDDPPPPKAAGYEAAVEDLTTFFEKVRLPANPIQLENCTRIEKPKLFVESHLSVLHSENQWRAKKPYFERLNTLKSFLSQHQSFDNGDQE